MNGPYPFQRILLATENTEFDTGAERIAFAMARHCNVPLRAIIPIASNPEYEVAAPELALREEQAAAAKVDALRERARQAGVELHIQVRRGTEVHREIVEEAAATRTDLIVIRRRGKPGFLRKLLVGEMVSKVIHDASCGVLTVPRNAQFWQRGVLAAIGDTPLATELTRVSAMIAGICNIPLTLVSTAAHPDCRARADELNAASVQQAQTLCRDVRGMVRTGEPALEIAAAASETAADLIVLGRQRYHVVPFNLGSTSIMQKVIGNIDVPALVLPS